VEPGCTPDLQDRNLCGPQLVISLSKDLGLIPGSGPTASAGGMFKQMGALNMQSAEEQAKEEALLVEQMQGMAINNRGNVISISVPFVDYGYSGKFFNANIEVSGNNGGSYLAVRTMPDDDGIYSPNGAVEIDHYTPHILRGTFSGSLVDRETIKNATRNNPGLTIADRISGTFVVSAPWRGSNAAPETGPDSAIMTGAREDMIDFMIKIPEDMRRSLFTGEKLDSLCELGFQDEQLASLGIVGSCAGSGGATTASIPQCDCRCEVYEQMREIPLCQTQCTDTWETMQCRVQTKSLTETGEWDAETRRYQTELQLLGIKGSMYDIQSRAFAAALPNKRAKMWADLDTVREELASEEMQELLEIRAQNEATPDYDAETQSYKAALEQAGKSADEVHGLTTLFSNGNELMRSALWKDLEAQ
jgi:hypothetical protein